MTPTFTFAIIIVIVALSFDFLNGFHDAANSIATVVSTRVLSPRVAVLWAAFFNFVAAFTFGTAVASRSRGFARRPPRRICHAAGRCQAHDALVVVWPGC